MLPNMRLPLSSRCIKYLMFAFNSVFVVTGIILVTIGSVIFGIFSEYFQFLDHKFLSVSHLLIVTGAIIFVVAFFGCCGALRENYCMLLIFSIFLVVIFILELAGGISGYILRDEARGVLQMNMNDSMTNFNDTYRIWFKMQSQMKCCGTLGAADWLIALKNDSGIIPMSCCPPVENALGAVNCTIGMAYKTGCLDSLVEIITSHAVQIGAAGISIAFIQAIGIWFSIYLGRSIKRTYQTM